MTWTWTYDGDPTASDTAAVRFAVGDTDTTDQLLSDEEIAYLLTEYGTVTAAAVSACEALAAKFARQVDRQVGNLRLSSSQRAAQFRELAATLRRRAALTATPYAGGLTYTDKDARAADTDRVKPAFTKGTGNVYDYDRYERFN